MIPKRPPLTSVVQEAISRFIEQQCGIRLGPEKGYLVDHRLVPVLQHFQLTSFEALRDRLMDKQDHEMRDRVLEAITTHETAFFRDRHPFEALRQVVLPQAAKRWQATRASLGRAAGPIRIWCAACSSGQEPWSMAMAILEWLPLCGVPGLAAGDFHILATDLSARILEQAKRGAYTETEIARGLTPGQVARFLTRPVGAKALQEVRPELRSMVEFRRVNMQEPFRTQGFFDLILCRNVLIYFADPFKRQICESFHAMLHPGAYLMLGAAESLFGFTESFITQRHGDTLLYRRP